jgi:hypothetical protein
MKITTIDFDIIMHPCIDIFNDSDLTADQYLNRYDFLGHMAADLELYVQLTNFILSFDKEKIVFIYAHSDIIDHLKEITEPIDLYNIDYHHDVIYEENINWKSPLKEYNEGNWVKKLWDDGKIKKYVWLKDYKSENPSSKVEKKYITSKHFIYLYNLNELKDSDKIYISLSPEWIPSYYTCLYDLWEDLTKLK